jgi:hypothetical protein
VEKQTKGHNSTQTRCSPKSFLDNHLNVKLIQLKDWTRSTPVVKEKLYSGDRQRTIILKTFIEVKIPFLTIINTVRSFNCERLSTTHQRLKRVETRKFGTLFLVEKKTTKGHQLGKTHCSSFLYICTLGSLNCESLNKIQSAVNEQWKNIILETKFLRQTDIDVSSNVPIPHRALSGLIINSNI